MPRSGDGSREIIIAATLFVIFVVIATAVSHNATAPVDRAVLLSLRDPLNPARPRGPDWLVEAARDLTSLGSVIIVFLFTGIVAGYWLFTGRSRSAAFLLVAVVGAAVLNDVLKLLFDRARPDAILQSARVFTAGFPSGHAALSSAAYLSATALIGRQGRNGGRTFLTGIALGVVLLIGLSRLYLGLHYPTDVIAGWCVGGFWFVLCRWLMRHG